MCGGPVSRATSNFTVIFLFSAFSCTRLIGDFSSEKVASGVVATAVAAVVVWLESFVMITSSLASPDPDDVQEADVAAAEEDAGEEDDLALEGTKGTEAGFKLDLIIAEAVAGAVGADGTCGG